MDKSIKNSKKLLIVLMILLAIAIGFASAYFQPQVNSPFAASTTVITKTTDVLTFSKGNNISLTMTQQNFGSEAGNLTGSSTVMASLLANNDTNSASNTYNVYFNITGNSFHYTTNPTNTPEILLTVTNPSGSPVTSITGLTYTTVNGVSGFDITEKKGLIQIASNYTITSNSGVTATTQTWGITITIVNLDTNQQDNTNKRFSGQAIIQKNEITLAMFDYYAPSKIDNLLPPHFIENYTAKGFKKADSLPANFVATEDNTISIIPPDDPEELEEMGMDVSSFLPIYIWFEEDPITNDETGTIYYYSEADIIYFNQDVSSFFSYWRGLTDISGLAYINTSYVYDMNRLFYECDSLSSLTGLENWDVSSVTDMHSMFSYTEALSSINALANWDVAMVQDMSGMFSNCTSLQTLTGLENWKTKSLYRINETFNYCDSLTNINALSNWDVSYVWDMSYLFGSCTNLSNISALANWDINSPKMEAVFYSCSSLSNLSPLANWDVSEVNNMRFLFSGCTSITDISALANWKVRRVSNMMSMFSNCTGITSIAPLANWKVKPTNVSSMFQNCTGIIDASAINDWDVSNVSYTSNTFSANGFWHMFQNVSGHPTFSKRSGTWDANGSFIPS